MRIEEKRSPIILLVELDGGRTRAALAGERSFDVRPCLSLRGARGELPRLFPDALVVAFAEPSPDDVTDFRSLTGVAKAPILVVSQPPREELRVTELLKAGAGGYLFADDLFRLGSAVRELLEGGVPMSSPVSRLVLGRARRSSASMAAVRLPSPPSDLLSKRQLEIVRLLSNGHSYEDIALALGLSVNTVRSHVRTIYERLGVSTKVEAVMAAIELRLFLPDAGR